MSISANIGSKIDKDILKILKNSEKPVSTREISLRINGSWHSVYTHCLKLQLKRKINGFRISNINVWEIKK